MDETFGPSLTISNLTNSNYTNYTNYSNYTNYTNYTTYSNYSNYSNYGNNKYISEEEDENTFIGGRIILIIFSPLLLCIVGIVCLSFYDNCIIECIKSIKKKKENFYLYIESFNAPIVNQKLNKKYIKKLNKDNKDYIQNKTDIQCSICIDDINIKKTLVLDCGHAFCKDCVQTWVFKQISNGQQPNCPMCRQNIVREEDIKKPNNYIVINISYDSDASDVSDVSDAPSYWD